MAFITKFFASRSVVAPVEELNLSSNQIDASAFEEFVKKSLKINPFLKTVDLSGNVGEMPEPLTQTMNEYLERNRNPNSKDEEKEADSKGSDKPKKSKRLTKPKTNSPSEEPQTESSASSVAPDPSTQ
eukprot:TRINITY_DN3235_c0_g1_i1.p2 TRINITY_DN3235_c0_g1~~TRINITY_DN3235_c0_g1_i1.p2  ORF type:complete len:128 (+),score=24.38 TRINITY_DN3235_c0_g1_i1:781-1164(+)